MDVKTGDKKEWLKPVAVCDFAHELLARAYEEAAQIAADHRENAINGCGEGGCGDTIASEIRALKDSLTAAPQAGG